MVDFAELLNRPPRPKPLVPRLIIGITGHRPHKLPDPTTGYDRNNPLRIKLREQIKMVTQELLDRAPKDRTERYTDPYYVQNYLRYVEWRDKPTDPTAPLAVSGLALGIDQDACGVWYRMGLPFIAVIPFPGQELRWPKSSQDIYQQIITKYAAGVIHVSKVPPANYQEARDMMLKRDEWMCCLDDELIAVWDGSKGGTSHTVFHWNKINFLRPVHRIDPREYR